MPGRAEQCQLASPVPQLAKVPAIPPGRPDLSRHPGATCIYCSLPASIDLPAALCRAPTWPHDCESLSVEPGSRVTRCPGTGHRFTLFWMETAVSQIALWGIGAGVGVNIEVVSCGVAEAREDRFSAFAGLGGGGEGRET